MRRWSLRWERGVAVATVSAALAKPQAAGARIMPPSAAW